MNPTVDVLGLKLPKMEPAFYVVLALHVPAGLVAVVSGAVAALSRKGSRLHMGAGLLYFRVLGVVFLTACILTAMRVREDFHLLLIGLVSFIASCHGHLSPRRHAPGHADHIRGMGLSYVAMLTAFYVDNGAQLPGWNRLPHFTYWLLPIGVGVPVVARALSRARRQGQTSGSSAR
jgi:uncharacterized membrane protein